MKNVQISLSKLTSLQQAMQRCCMGKEAEVTDKEEVMAKVMEAFIIWERAEHEVYGSTDDALAMMSRVIEKMRNGEIVVNVKITKKQWDKIIK